jgi:hypothetical protein
MSSVKISGQKFRRQNSRRANMFLPGRRGETILSSLTGLRLFAVGYRLHQGGARAGLGGQEV